MGQLCARCRKGQITKRGEDQVRPIDDKEAMWRRTAIARGMDPEEWKAVEDEYFWLWWNSTSAEPIPSDNWQEIRLAQLQLCADKDK